MAQHSCEDMKPIDTPSRFSTFTQATRDHTLNPIWAHNPMANQYNQSKYLTLLKQICAHNPSTSQVSQANLSNSLTFQYPLDPGEHFSEICYRNRAARFPSEMIQVHLPKFQAKDDCNFNS